jgi:hypothetical protein
MLFLETEAGELIAAKHIVRIGGLNTRPTRSWHDIDYVHGGDARSTTASAEAVEYFLDEAQS